MIKFFRKIRRRLLKENRFSRYLLYAIGEIVLVVIGILIALQINNWNVLKKEARLEQTYLKGIRLDLLSDIEQATDIINQHTKQINLMKRIEPHFKFDPLFEIKGIDTTSLPLHRLFKRRISFRSTKGTYNSLISDGKSNLLKNKELYHEIQSVYDEQHPRIFSLYDEFRTKQMELSIKYSYEEIHWDYKTLMKSGNEKIIADLASFWASANAYCLFLNNCILEMNQVIDKIEDELLEIE